MDADRFEALIRVLSQRDTRRRVFAALAGFAGFGLDAAVARKRKKHKNKKKKRACRNCCRADRSSCPKRSAACKPGNCPRFAITASWDSDRDHETYLFVPNAEGASLPSPFIETSCNFCAPDPYPFACVNQKPRDRATK
jgi:hypothetical protein